MASKPKSDRLRTVEGVKLLGSQILAWGRRLAGVFHRRPAPSGPSMHARPGRQYKRGFRRYPIEFNVSVKFLAAGAPDDTDQGELQDISGGGALFAPCHPEKYYAGQQLETTIYLAGTNEVQGCIRSAATVDRIEADPGASDGASSRVAVRFEQAFDFERIDRSRTGMNG